MLEKLSGDLLYRVLGNYKNLESISDNIRLIGKCVEKVEAELPYDLPCPIGGEFAPNDPVVTQWKIYDNTAQKYIIKESVYVYGSKAINRWKQEQEKKQEKNTDPTTREEIVGFRDVKPEITEKLLECFNKHYGTLSGEEQEKFKEAINIIHDKYEAEDKRKGQIETLLPDTKSGNLEGVREAIKLCPELIETKNEDGDTLLFIAAQNGHVEVVQELLKHKPNKIDAKTILAAHRFLLLFTNMNINIAKKRLI